MAIWILVSYLVCPVCPVISFEPREAVCHDRFGRLPSNEFNRRSCAMCYGYLTFQNHKVFPAEGQFDSFIIVFNISTFRQVGMTLR